MGPWEVRPAGLVMSTKGGNPPKSCHRPTLIPEPSSVQATGVVHIAAGMNHAHAMTASGALYSWGHNGAGQLGLGDTLTCPRPVIVRA